MFNKKLKAEVLEMKNRIIELEYTVKQLTCCHPIEKRNVMTAFNHKPSEFCGSCSKDIQFFVTSCEAKCRAAEIEKIIIKKKQKELSVEMKKVTKTQKELGCKAEIEKIIIKKKQKELSVEMKKVTKTQKELGCKNEKQKM